MSRGQRPRHSANVLRTSGGQHDLARQRIASIGSAVALIVFTLVTFGHLRVRHESGANAWLLVLADLAVVVVLVGFAVTTLVEEPATAMALVVIVLLSLVLEPRMEEAPRRHAQVDAPAFAALIHTTSCSHAGSPCDPLVRRRTA